jgi:hypothetical protein
MSAVVHRSVLACASGLSTGDVGLDAGTPNDSRGVSLVARTLSNDDVLAKGGDTLATGRDALFMGVNSGREEPQISSHSFDARDTKVGYGARNFPTREGGHGSTSLNVGVGVVQKTIGKCSVCAGTGTEANRRGTQDCVGGGVCILGVREDAPSGAIGTTDDDSGGGTLGMGDGTGQLDRGAQDLGPYAPTQRN